MQPHHHAENCAWVDHNPCDPPHPNPCTNLTFKNGLLKPFRELKAFEVMSHQVSLQGLAITFLCSKLWQFISFGLTVSWAHEHALKKRRGKYLKMGLLPSFPLKLFSCQGVSQGCILSPCLFNLYAEYIRRNVRLDEAQAGIKIAGRNINNLIYVDDTILMAESEEELKSLLMKVKEWKNWLKSQHSEN